MKKVIAFLLLFSIGFSQLSVISFYIDSCKKSFVDKKDYDGEKETTEKSKEEIEENDNFFQFNKITYSNKLLVLEGKQYFNISKLLYSNPFKKKDIKPPQYS